MITETIQRDEVRGVLKQNKAERLTNRIKRILKDDSFKHIISENNLIIKNSKGCYINLENANFKSNIENLPMDFIHSLEVEWSEANKTLHVLGLLN